MRYALLCCFIIAGLSSLPCTAKERSTIIAGNFSASNSNAALPEDWQPLEFKDIETHTVYRLVNDNGIFVVQAESHASSSGLTRKLTVNPLEHPLLSWSWKIANVYEKGDISKKQGDDYPARIYITFAYDRDKVGFWERVKFNTIKLFYGEYPPINAINYIWASKAPPELITPNPFTDRVKMIVLQSGDEKKNQWISETRNIAEDYRKAFGEEPPMISGIAIMTDSDNTGESATAWYGNIVFSRGTDAP